METRDDDQPADAIRAEARTVDIGRESEPGRILLAEEVARIDKRRVETGRVRILTQTDVVEEVVRETLEDRRLEITRVPVDRMIMAGETVPQVRTEGHVTIIPILEEVLVVEKRLVLKEELRVAQHVEQRAFETPVSLRRQRAVIEPDLPIGSPIPTEER